MREQHEEGDESALSIRYSIFLNFFINDFLLLYILQKQADSKM